MKARHKDTGEIIELAEEGIISCDGRRFCWHQVELIPEPIDECEPSLPSNLDEAAENSWAVYEYRESPRGLYSTCYLDGFKDGAKWMAGQIDNESYEEEAQELYTNENGTHCVVSVGTDYKPGDILIVYIRKKN